MFLHDSAAGIFGVPGLALHQAQAVQLADRIVNLGKHYDLTVSPKTMAIVSLVTVAAMIEVPRVRLLGAVLRERAAAQKAQARATQRPAAGPAGLRAPPASGVSRETAPPDTAVPRGAADVDFSDAGAGILSLDGSIPPGVKIETGLAGAPLPPTKGKLDFTGGVASRFLARKH